MITKLIGKPKEHQMQMDYKEINDHPRVFINDNGEIIGYIWYSIEDAVMDLEMIEIIEKEQGYGTEAIEFLFKNLPITQIKGLVLGENGMRAYWFWESLGAELDTSPEDIENNIVRDCYFTLSRSN